MVSSANTGEASELAREHARAILAEGRFHSAPVPRPLHGALQSLGRALQSPLGVLNELVTRLATITPGGSTVVWALLALGVLAASAALALRGARRSLHAAAAGTLAPGASSPSAAELQRLAATAEVRGLHGEAVRLRFRAGLQLLAESERVAVGPSMLNAEVSQALASERFDRLARSFEEIVYGGRAAAVEDAQAARAEWARLLSQGRRER